MTSGLTEAIILAGGRAERLGDVARGRPKPLVTIAGRPLVAYQVALLARAGVRRVLLSCAAGQGEQFTGALDGCPIRIVPVEEPEPLGRGGGFRFAAAERASSGDVYALNGDELLDIDLRALLRRHREAGTAATVAVAQPRSPFAVVQLANGDLIAGFDERAAAPWWVSCGVYVLSERALERFPERGDHESSAFPQFAAEGDLAAFRHGGRWLTVNTPKDLRNAEEYLATHPGWPA